MYRVVARLTSLALLLVPSAALLAASHKPIDENDRVPAGYVHAQAKAEHKKGPAPLDMPMERMILSLQRRAGADAEIDALLARQQDPNSADFHRWLSPEEFAQRFGVSDDDLATITDWLQSHGFTIDEVAAGRGTVNFSGNVLQVEHAFRTQIDEYLVDGVVRHANSSIPTMPRALAATVHGLVSLHSFPRPAHNMGVRHLSAEDAAAVAERFATGPRPLWTGTANNTAGTYLSPTDWAKVYNAQTTYTANGTGTGVVIGIVGRTNPGTANWSTFRSTLGLPANTPTIIVNGTNPGDAGAGEDGEADLDAEWSGGVAPGATVKFVASKSTSTTDGVDLSAQYIVNNNIGAVMSTSFGQCESSMGATENSFYNNLWSQAATAGITSMVSTGDSGPAGCNGGSDTTASGGYGVNGLASTPYNVAVGATQLSNSSSYWSGGSPTGYIPEAPWNESGTVSGGSGLWSTSSGASSTYAKPSWQVAPGVPSTSHRYLPDISLDGSDMFFGNYGMLVYSQGSMGTTGGTSAAAPSFAGVMALIVQKYGRQGNANVKLYQLGQAQYASSGPAVYHDITSGNNNVPGETGWTAATGWDEATGLGTPDVTSLVNNWGGSATTYSISGSAGTTGATVSTTGHTATSDASNNYSLTGLAAGTYTVTPSKSGCTFSPASSSVTISTANVTGVNFTASCTAPTYSISGNAGTTSATVTIGSTTTTSDSSSNFTASGFANGTYTVTPSKSGCTFSPASSSVTVSSANVTGVNFTASCGSGGSGLTNGNFETGSLSPWVSSGTTSVISSGAHGGTYAAQLGSTSPSTDITLAQTFTLPANASQLSFWVKIVCPDTITYDWATATLKDNSTAATTTPLAKTCTNTGAWQQVTANVSASAGHSVTLTFANHDDNYAGDATYSQWDDVTVTTATATYSISGSAGTSGATVSTTGASATSDASNNYTLSGLANGTYTVTPSKSGCTFSPASSSVTVSSANVTGVNFTASCGGGSTTLFSNGFESTTGWYTQQVSGTAGAWSVNTAGTHPSVSPHSGSYLAIFNSYTSAAGNATRLYNNTAITASSYTTVTLKFWMYHETGYSTDADKIQAQVSTNGGTSWTNVGAAVNRYNGTTGWAQVSVDISAYKGSPITVGLVGTSAYGNDIHIDDVTVIGQ